MVIGEAPGAQEHYKQKPFIGDSGQLLRRTLDEINKSLGTEYTFYFTNVVMCRPPDNRDPTDQEILNCFDRLINEIETVKPKKILIVGGTALKALLGIKKISQVRGEIKEFRGIETLATWHPSFILRPNGRIHFQSFVDDIVRLIEGEQHIGDWLEPRKFTLIQSLADIAKCYQHLLSHYANGEPTSLDIETTELVCWLGFPLWIGIRSKDMTFIISHEVFKESVDLFPAHIQWVVHESRMEYQWMKMHYGIELNNIDDTLVLAHLIDGRTGQHISKSLDTLSQQFLGYPSWKGPMDKYKKCMFNAPIPELHEYLSRDVEADLSLFNVLVKEAKNDGVWDAYQNVVRPAIPFTNRMQYHGIRVDIQYLEECEEALDTEISELKTEIHDIVGDRNFNPTSHQQLSYLLYEQFRLPNTNKNSVDEKTLKDLLVISDHPIISKILDLRKLSKLNSTYVKGLYKLVAPDGRIHAKWLLEGTETGRLSSQLPNLQNIPRPGTTKVNIRRAFLPEEGYIFCEPDYSANELRVGAHYSQDKNLIKLLNENVDMHRRFAGFILGKDETAVEKIERQFAKNMLFACMFDADERSLVYTFKKDFPFLTQELASGALKFMRGQFPDLHLQALRFKNEALKNHYVSTLFGRKRRFPLITAENRDEILRQSTNASIQGTASDICLLSGIKIEKELPEVKLHMIIHDSLPCSIPNKSVVDDIVNLMCDVPFESDVKWTVEVKLSDRWGE